MDQIIEYRLLDRFYLSFIIEYSFLQKHYQHHFEQVEQLILFPFRHCEVYWTFQVKHCSCSKLWFFNRF